MTLQARLTLWSVVVMTAIVVVISSFDLGHDMDRQFEATLERAELLKRVAVNTVLQALDRNRNVPLREALRDPHIAAEFVDILTASHAVLEIAVCDPKNEILVDSDPSRLGLTFPPYPNFQPIVQKTGWLEKTRILFTGNRYFQLEQPLGSGDQVLLHVRVVVFPALMRQDIVPAMHKSAVVAGFSVIGAIVVTLIFSSIMFRPLGRLGEMLDLVAKGEYEAPVQLPPPSSGADEFGIMASKVSLLGQQLRGAQYDISDLRGNFEHMLNDLEDAVLIFSRERRLVIASGAVERFLGKMRSDLIGQSLPEIFPPGTPMGLLLAQATQTGRPLRNRRVPLIHPEDGPAAVSVVLLTVDLVEPLSSTAGSGRGPGVVVRLRDPEATRQLKRQLQTADRLSATNRIIGGVAHEVKNPLNAILMHVELARMKMARGDHDLGAHMEIISREILRLDRVVKTFLDFTRPVELMLTDVRVDSFLSEIVDLARPQAVSAGIKVDVLERADSAIMRVDLDLLKQAALNIVMNAIEAMPGGGELRFESEIREDEAEIRISDSGPGIPPELREKIFRLYFTTKKEGSGIGLAMTYRIVQLHDGTIDFSSDPGRGTTFVLRLPLLI